VPPVLFFAIVYHIDVLVLIIILKIRFKEAETEAYKALLGAGLGFSRFDFVWLFANFGSSKKRYRIIPITTPTVKIAYT
jgi:hypothetical protein